MLENRVAPISETTIRFFSFFTILTNILTAVYFTILSFQADKPHSSIASAGTVTAITVYITVVGLVYQITLRHLWQPQGMQRIVDELLHTIIPILVIIFWSISGRNRTLRYSSAFVWLMYPLVYLIFILVRGNASGFYPYPFVDVSKTGLSKVLQNSAFLMLLFLALSFVYIFIGKKLKES